MKSAILAVLTAISLSGCFATVGVSVPVAPMYGYPMYVQPAPVAIYPPFGFGFYEHYHGGYHGHGGRR